MAEGYGGGDSSTQELKIGRMLESKASEDVLCQPHPVIEAP